MSLAVSSIAVLAALLLALAAPVRVVFRIARSNEVEGQLSCHWLFGLVKLRVAIPGAATRSGRGRKPARKPRAGAPSGGAGGVVAVLTRPAFRRHALRYVKRFLHAVHARDLYVRLHIGLGDPADTGRLWALLGPLAGIAGRLRTAEVRIEPDFLDPVLEIGGRGEMRLIPLQFIFLAVAFAMSPTTLRAWRALRQQAV